MPPIRSSASSGILRAFSSNSSAPSGSAGDAAPSPPKKRTPARATSREYVWPPEDLPEWRRTLMKVVSQWGGLMFFGFFMGIAYASKKWAEWEMDVLDRELTKPRRKSLRGLERER